jgi:sterol desaturase/sphingolipid hydroxylase (fatty acid hydroxylase superfamily)
LLSLLLLDLAGYGLHRLYHRVPLLWRFHAVHHSDDQLDSTTGVRHHFVELAITLVALQGLSLLLGIPEPVFAGYGVVLVVLQFLQHANASLPPALERFLGLVTITPRMHAVHHSNDMHLANMNFGMVLNLWDRCFGTLLRGGGPDPERIVFGVGSDRRHARSLLRLLIKPFIGP